MTTTGRQAPWELYTTKGDAEVSWFEATPAQSIRPRLHYGRIILAAIRKWVGA